MAAERRSLTPWLYGFAILGVALAFQGSRGIFEPDEGRYADIAVNMLRSGDWWIPRLQGLVYLDKPPAFYWSVAAGMKVLGANEWGARLGQALALTATALLVTVWAGRAWGTRLGRLSGAAYATTLLPTVAANTLTPDTLLTLWVTAAYFSYWQVRETTSKESPPVGARWGWALALGTSAGLGLLTKGTAALVCLAPIGLHILWERRLLRYLRRPEIWVAAGLGTVIGSFWYVKVSGHLPGAAEYFFDNQVAGRLWKDSYQRNSHWWAPFEIYGGVLLFGSLPWSWAWLGLRRAERRQALGEAMRGDALGRFLVLATALPLLIFGLASSRLPLYILPIFPSLVMLTIFFAVGVRGRAAEDRSPWGRRMLLAMLAVVALKGLGAMAPIDRDSRVLAEQLEQAGVESEECIVVLQMKVHALAFYGFPRASWSTIGPEEYPYFEPPRTISEDLPPLLDTCGSRAHFLVKPKHQASAADLLAAHQLQCGGYLPISPRVGLFSCALPGQQETMSERR